MPKETKAQKTAKTVAKVKEGAYGGKAKHGKMKLRPTSKGVNFTLGSFGLFSTILTPIRARKEAKEYTGKKDPSFMDSMKMIYPFMGKPRKKFGLNPGDA